MTAQRPRVGVGAFIRDADGRALLVRRKRDPEAGCWGLPGGKVEDGESCAEAVAREIREELGVTLSVGDVLCVSELIDLDGAYHWIAPVYAATITEGEPGVCEPDALSAWGWFALDALPEPLARSILDAASAISPVP